MARPSAYGFDRSIVVVGAHPAGPAAGRSLFLGLIRIVARLLPAIIVIADGGRKYGRIETVFLVPCLAAAIGLGTCTARRRRIIGLTGSLAFDAGVAFIARFVAGARLTPFLLERAVVLVIVIGRVVLLAIIVAPPALVVLLRAAVGHDAEIVIGELQVIFGLHTVAIHLRIVCELLVFLEQLGGIAPCPAVDPVGLSALLAVATASAAAIVATILIQRISLP